jgi:hypothetical protein
LTSLQQLRFSRCSLLHSPLDLGALSPTITAAMHSCPGPQPAWKRGSGRQVSHNKCNAVHGWKTHPRAQSCTRHCAYKGTSWCHSGPEPSTHPPTGTASPPLDWTPLTNTLPCEASSSSPNPNWPFVPLTCGAMHDARSARIDSCCSADSTLWLCLRLYSTLTSTCARTAVGEC